MKKSFSVILGVLLFATTANAGRIDREPISWLRRGNAEPQEVSLVGEVRCKKGCTDHESCRLVFTRAGSGETFDVEEGSALEATHCKSPGHDLKVKLVGRLTPSFLFWGGNIAVKRFEVIGEGPTRICSVSNDRLPAPREWGGGRAILQ